MLGRLLEEEECRMRRERDGLNAEAGEDEDAAGTLKASSVEAVEAGEAGEKARRQPGRNA